MKKIILLIALLAIHNLNADSYENYNIPFAVKNISGYDTTSFVIDFDYGIAWQDKGSYDLGIIPHQANLAQPGIPYINTLQLGQILNTGTGPMYRPQVSSQPGRGVHTVLSNGTQGKLSPSSGTHDHAGYTYPGINRLAFIHYVIIPGGTIVQIPELIQNGGAVTRDHYIILPDGNGNATVTKEDGACDAKCTPPAGKPTPTIDANGNLAWQ